MAKNKFCEIQENSDLNMSRFALKMNMTRNRASYLSKYEERELLEKLSLAEAVRLAEFVNGNVYDVFNLEDPRQSGVNHN